MNTIADTPDLIEAWRLLALKGALRLELQGMRHSSGRSATVTVRSILRAAGKPAPRNRKALDGAYVTHLKEIGILAEGRT